jgi:hypothetical protein
MSDKKDKKSKNKKPKLAYFLPAISSKKFKDYFNCKDFSDCSIVFPGGEEYPTHKAILSNCETFEKEFENSNKYTFEKTIDDSTAKTVVKFLYTGLLEYDSEAILVDFMLLANQLKIKNLSGKILYKGKEFKVQPKVYLRGIMDYVEKDEKRLSEFPSLLESVNFKKLEKEDLDSLYKKRKWLQKQSKFLHQMILSKTF